MGLAFVDSVVVADHPERDDTVTPANFRLSTYEHLLHVGLPTAADPSSALGRDAWDVTHYQLVLLPDFETESLQGYIAVSFTTLESGLDHIDLDLYDEFTIDDVHIDYESLAYDLSLDVLRIYFPRSLQLGESLTVNIDYRGTPEPTGALGLDFDVTAAGRPILATISEPFYARSWWPCKDTTTDKATVDLRVVVPENMYVASAGTLEEVIYDGGRAVYHWFSDYPISTYNVSLAVTEYVSWTENYISSEGVEFPLEFHVFPEDEQVARFEFERVGQMIDFFSDLYGPYPFPDEKYGMAELVLAGAMEHQTMTSYGDFFLTGDRYYEGIVAHELSHSWWGNLVTLRNWDDLWLHEALATFSDGLWREHIDGRAEYIDFLQQRSASCCGFNGPISPPVKLFNQTVYQKGAWMLHMLRELIGDTDFFAALRRLTANPELRYQNFGETDFVEAFEAQTGQDLSWFFDQWLRRTGRPEIAVAPEAGGPVDQTVWIKVSQTQQDPEWRFPLRLRVQLPSGPVDLDIFITERTTEFVVNVAEWPTSIEIDPDVQLLHFDTGSVLVTAAPESSRHRTKLLRNTPNPFNPRTTLRFSLAEPATIRLRIFDLRGRELRVIHCGALQPGDHERLWDGTDREGRTVASGTYLVRMEGATVVPPALSITLVR
jgi:aminopeptidase N